MRRKTPSCTAGSRSSTNIVFQSRPSDARQRRPADRVCYVDTAERSSGAGWMIVDVDGDVGDWSAAVLFYFYLLKFINQTKTYTQWTQWNRQKIDRLNGQIPWCFCYLDTDGPWQPALYFTRSGTLIHTLYMYTWNYSAISRFMKISSSPVISLPTVTNSPLCVPMLGWSRIGNGLWRIEWLRHRWRHRWT